MTKQEAIEMLKTICGDCRLFPKCAYKKSECFTALDMAIEALTHFNSESNSIKNELNDDLISRQALYEILDEYDEGKIYWGEAEDKIGNLPSAQQERWIPCSERLPEEYGEYRITWKTSCVPNRRFIGDCEYVASSEWDIEHDRWKGQWLLVDYVKAYPDVEVIAWKPLEEPYKGVDNE